MKSTWIGITLIALFLAVVCGLAIGCAVPSSTSTPSSTPSPPESSPPTAEAPPTPPPAEQPAPIPQSGAIVGKWQHGLPEECPPSMDPRLWDKFKEASKSQTYTLEFLKDGQVLYSSKTSIDAGTYRFIGDDHVEITWDVLGEAFWTMFGGTVYKIQISRDKMTLDKGEKSITLKRVR